MDNGLNWIFFQFNTKYISCQYACRIFIQCWTHASQHEYLELIHSSSLSIRVCLFLDCAICHFLNLYSQCFKVKTQLFLSQYPSSINLNIIQCVRIILFLHSLLIFLLYTHKINKIQLEYCIFLNICSIKFHGLLLMVFPKETNIKGLNFSRVCSL